jgi:hypothetical protein
MTRRSSSGRHAAWLLAVLVWTPRPAAAACEMIVDATGAGTHRTIQSAVDDLPNPGPCRIVVTPGTYRESVSIAHRNVLAASEAERVVVAAARGATVRPPGGHAFAIRGSKYITIGGFTITGAHDAAIALAGGEGANDAIALAGNDVHANGRERGGSGIRVGAGNTRTAIVNNLLRHNGRDGVTLDGGAPAGTTFVVNNTIVANDWNGLAIGRDADVFVVNNVVAGNGLGEGSAGGRWGLTRERVRGAGAPERIVVTHNLFYRNGAGQTSVAGGDIDNIAQTLDATDAANLTTNGREGTGVDGCAFQDCSASPGLSAIFVGSGLGPDFRLAPGSPAVGIGRSRLIVDGIQWIPTADVDGQPRLSSDATDAGYAILRPRE